MERKASIPARHSIRTRLLMLFLGLTTMALIVSGYLAVTTLYAASNSAQQVSRSVLKTQAADFMVQIIEKTAQQNDAILALVRQDANTVAFYASDLFANAADFYESSQWRAADHMTVRSDGQFANDENDVASVFVPNMITINEEIIFNLELSSHLDYILRSVYENSENITAVYMGTKDEITRYYPNVNLGAVLPPDFQVSQRPWYSNAVQDNPERQVAWSEIYEDATGQGFLVTAAIPVYHADALIGVIGIDVSLNDIQTTVENTQIFENSYTFLIDESGGAIVLPDQGYLDIFGQDAANFETAPNLKDSSANFALIVEAMLNGETGFNEIEHGDDALFVAYAPLQNTGWSLATVVPASQLLKSVNDLQQEITENTRQLVFTRVLASVLILLTLTTVIGFWATNQLVTPIQALVTAVQKIGAGDWTTPLPKARKDEIGVLTKTFQGVASQLHDTLSELEQRVDQRTSALEHRALQLQAAAEVGRAAATIRDLDQLLDQVTHLISDRFGYDHTGVFLLDEKGEYALLRAANSAGGQRMIARQHKLRVGEVGIVGYVTGKQEPRIALDVGQDAVFFDNPDMPETRSEMALPLIVGGQMLGALDIQSAAGSAFTDDDIAVLQVLADQVAIAIENARLLTESQQALERARQAYGELSRNAWGDLLRAQPDLGFLAALNQNILPATGAWSAGMVEASQRGEIVKIDAQTIAIPIKLREQVLGVVRLQKPSGSKSWLPDEINLMETIINQLETALESAQLYQETRRRAEREQLVTEITTKIRANTDPQAMLQTAVSELQRALKANRAQMLIHMPEQES